MTNKQIADIFLRIADALEIKGENIFRIRAYRSAAQTIKGLAREVKDIYSSDPAELLNIPGIGKDLSAKIKELLETGNLEYFNKLMKEFPEGFLDMLDLAGLGPKKLKKLYDQLGIENVDDLEKACNKGELEELDGLGAKTQEKLIDAIKYYRKKAGRMLLQEAAEIADGIIGYLRTERTFKKISVAGSLRRGAETVGDIDILAVAADTGKAIEHFALNPETREVIAKGPTKCSIALKNTQQVDLRVVPNESFGAALQYFTGSQQHNVRLRRIAKQKGLKVNEYGVFRVTKSNKEKNVASRTEQDVYGVLGMDLVPPELRENRGEIEAAIAGKIPKDLIAQKHIKGDLHVHTDATDGRSSIEHIIDAAVERGYKYIAVTDHSKLVRIANGLDEKQLLKHVEKIRKIGAKTKEIEILLGVEVDILKNGELDLADHALKELDIVIAAIHSNFSMDQNAQTNRVLKAMDNPYVNVLAHPSGRLITTRSPLRLDFDEIFKKAAKNNIFLEINTHGERIDLNDANCIRARELGAKFVINTDAHDIDQLDLMKYGVITARRGWVRKKDVLNTHSLKDVKKQLKR